MDRENGMCSIARDAIDIEIFGSVEMLDHEQSAPRARLVLVRRVQKSATLNQWMFDCNFTGNE